MIEVWHHGTSRENAESIRREGFRVGSWFAKEVWQAIAVGGPVVLAVMLERERLSADVDWQVHALVPLGPERIALCVDHQLQLTPPPSMA